MKTNQAISNVLKPLVLATLLAINSGAHALCVNPSGSLDDSSMETAIIDRSLLPACVAQAVVAPAATPPAISPSVHAADKSNDKDKAMRKAKGEDQQTRLARDCRTARGESRIGFVGAVDMLPSC